MEILRKSKMSPTGKRIKIALHFERHLFYVYWGSDFFLQFKLCIIGIVLLARNSLDLAINNRYGTKPKLPLRSAKDEVKKEEERKRLEEEKKKMMEMKRSMDDDTLKLMQDMEALLQKKKGEEEKRRLEEEQRRKLAKEDIESKKKEGICHKEF